MLRQGPEGRHGAFIFSQWACRIAARGPRFLPFCFVWPLVVPSLSAGAAKVRYYPVQPEDNPHDVTPTPDAGERQRESPVQRPGFSVSCEVLTQSYPEHQKMARPAGLEPATPRFEVWCCIR